NYTKYAGGYAIASGQNFITRIEGSISNVIGLPLEKVIPILKKDNLLKY
ncbi:Maf family protein, partial [Candidatus Gottesmanbacteria bacterium]|nr:Maf family protein [Candidatus Gottesmanbacteria bacterium]